MNILIPMAGAGSRFKEKGYVFPKPFIDVNGMPMIMNVLENMYFEDAKYIFLVRKEHLEEYQFEEILMRRLPRTKFEVITVNGLTQGAACTALLAEDLIDTDESLMIVNSDQLIEYQKNNFNYMLDLDIDGMIFCFNSIHPKWSYVRLDNVGHISEVREKKPISDIATTGIYFWKHGSDFVRSAYDMIEADDRFNDEFYIAPTFNYLIKKNKKFIPFYVDKMWGLGTPEDLEYFLDNSDIKFI